VIEDKVSGSVPFFERQGGKMVLDLVEKGALDMSVNPDGEILYSNNKNFNFNNL
jgi:hypothetical protein